MRNLILLAALPVLVLACESYPGEGAAKANGRIAVSTSALSLSGISEACYSLQVTNAAGDIVWSKRDVCSTQYGDSKGGISYVGTCDATSPEHEVSLTLTSMTDSSGAAVTDFTNPCPSGSACTQKATCVENRDTPVDFDLTVMRSAEQGFFDVAVSIDDVACSAKIDCDSKLLTNPETGERAPTMVLAFACSSGSAEAMRMSDIVLDCDSPQGPISITIDPSEFSGNYSRSWGRPHEHVTEVASWRTPSSSSSSSASWAVGIAPDLSSLQERGVTSCTLHAAATATKSTDASWSPPEGYPYVDWSVPVVGQGGNGLAVTCPRDVATGQSSGLTQKIVKGDKYTKIGHVTLMK